MKRTKLATDKNPTFMMLVEEDPNTLKRTLGVIIRWSLWTKSKKGVDDPERKQKEEKAAAKEEKEKDTKETGTTVESMVIV